MNIKTGLDDIEKINEELLKSDIAKFQRPSRGRSIWQLVNTLVPYTALWVLAYYAFQYSFWLTIPVTLVASGFLVRIFIIFHDCGHQSFFRSKKANDFWGAITGVLTFTPYHFWTANHARHHDTSGNLDKRGFGDVWTMTVSEYMNSPWRIRLKYRLYRNPFIMFLLGPLLIVLVSNRLTKSAVNSKERNSVYINNVVIILLAVALSLIMGFQAYIVIQALVLLVGLIGGVWLFYVQHQFEGVYWARNDEWDFIAASLMGGSFYKLPKILNWFSGSIGYHHVHHLMTGIPNYNLAKCHEEIPAIGVIKPTGIRTSLKSLSYRLWDESQAKLVSFRKARQSFKAKSQWGMNRSMAEY
jgi:omega-6 fatty acid desaturase (delta-12 desaturase)